MDTKEHLLRNVLAIVNDLENPRDVLADDPTVVLADNMAPCGDCYTYDKEEDVWRDMDGDEVETTTQSGFEYIFAALSIEYTVSGVDRSFLGAEITVTVGGPHIYIDTRRNVVTGHWGSDTFTRSYSDNIGLHEAAEELFDQGA